MASLPPPPPFPISSFPPPSLSDFSQQPPRSMLENVGIKSSKKRSIDSLYNATSGSTSSASSLYSQVNENENDLKRQRTHPTPSPRNTVTYKAVASEDGGFVNWRDIDPNNWGHWLQLGELAFDEWKKGGETFRQAYVPLFRNPATVKGGKVVPFYMYIPAQYARYPLTGRIYDGKPALNWEKELKKDGESQDFENLFRKRDEWFKEALQKHEACNDLIEEGAYNLRPKILAGKKNKETGERRSSYVRFKIEFKGGKIKVPDISLFKLGEKSRDRRDMDFLQSDIFPKYKADIGIKTERLTFHEGQKNIFVKDCVVSISLPTKPPVYGTEGDRCLPGCHIVEEGFVDENQGVPESTEQ